MQLYAALVAPFNPVRSSHFGCQLWQVVKTVAAAVEVALSCAHRQACPQDAQTTDGNEEANAGASRRKGAVARRVFIGSGLHEWKNARLVVGGWRAGARHAGGRREA